MKIVMLCLHFSEYSVSLARALSVNNQILLVLSDKNFDAEVADYTILDGIDNLEYVVISHKKSLLSIFTNAWRIISSIKNFSPDVIHCQEQVKDYLMLSLPFLRRYPFVLTIHDPVLHSGIDTHRAKFSRLSLYYKIIRNYPDAIIVHGEKMRQVSATLYKKPVFSVHHGPLGVIFEKSDISKRAWQNGVCLFFGRIEEYKGIQYFIHAIENARAKGSDVIGFIAGRGSDLEPYRSKIENNPAFELLEKYLSPDEVIAAFLRANVVVMPYVDASQSGVGAYAIGTSRPIIATNVGSLTDLVIDGYNGIVVESKNVEQLSDAICKICNDQTLAKSYSLNSEKLGAGELSWHKAATLTQSIYSKLIAR